MEKKLKTKGSLLLFNMDLVPMTISGFPKISYEEKESFTKELNNLQQEKGLPILFCLYSDNYDQTTWMKAIQVYNALVPFLPIGCFELRAINLGNHLFNPYHQLANYQYEEVYPEYEIAHTIYLMGDEKVALKSAKKEYDEFTLIKGNTLSEMIANLSQNHKVRSKKNCNLSSTIIE